MSTSPPLAIVICSRDRASLLEGALVAIQATRRPGDEVVVVDSASRDASVRELASGFPGVTVARCEEAGLARARNVGVRSSTAPLVAFTDDDCRPTREWVTAVASSFADDPHVGFVTGKVTPDRMEGPMLAIGGADERRVLELPSDPAEFGHGANFAVRRQALEVIQGFDEALGVGSRFPGAEEHDAFWRILRAGWVGRYEPEVVVVHKQWRTRRQYLRSEYGYGLGEAAFVVKAIRIERRAGLRLLGHRLGRFGVFSIARALRQRYETGAAGDTLRLAGIVVGTVAAARLPLDGTRFRPGAGRRV